jgi:chromosome segregation ATPase
MSVSLGQVASDIEQMSSQLSHILALSNKIGGFNDGPHLREQIQCDVKAILDSSQTVKRAFAALKESDPPGLDDHHRRFEQLRARIQAELPKVIAKLRDNTAPGAGAAANYTEPQLDQRLLDRDSDLIDVLEQQVGEIVAVMREVNSLFGQTLAELQAQRHMLTAIEGHTAAAAEEMGKGNEALEEAGEHQKKSTKCICWIAVIVAAVVVAVVLLVLWKTVWSKKSPPSPATPPPATPPPATPAPPRTALPTASPVPPPPTAPETPVE